MEQKCKTWSPSRMGMESVSSTCMPQTGSRTSRRARFGVCGSLDAFAPCCRMAAFCNREPKTRRSSQAPQEITSSQNRNRTMRARNVMGSKTVAPRWYPQVPMRSVYVRGKGVVKRKRVISRGCEARGAVERASHLVRTDISLLFTISYILMALFARDIDRKHKKAAEAVEKTLFSCGNAVNAHVWAENFRDQDRAVHLLEILHNRDPRAANRQPRTV